MITSRRAASPRLIGEPGASARRLIEQNVVLGLVGCFRSEEVSNMFKECTWGRGAGCCVLGLALMAAGCGGQSISDLASSVKDAASQGVQSVRETAQQVSEDVTGTARGLADKASEAAALAGAMRLAIDQPVETSACYVSFSWLQAAGIGVLQMQSYRTAEQESVPSVFVRVQHSVASLAELVDQTLDAQMFVQPQQDGPLWTATVQPIQLKVTSLEDKTLRAEIIGGTLVHSATGASQAVTGVFEGVLR